MMNQPVMSEQQKIAVVTGASRGIGAAIATQLRQQGYFVLGTATTATGADAISTRLGLQGRGSVLALGQPDMNLTIKQWVKQVESEFGPIRVLVNNAGMTHDQLLIKMQPEDIQNVLNVNLMAAMQLCQQVLPGMSKVRFGRIINISSVVARMGNAGQTSYAASKAALEGFSRSLAQEMGRRQITVNCVAPGFIATDMTQTLASEQQAALLAKIPLARLGHPEDVAAAVGFLASEAAGYITGMVLPVNGGLYLD